MTAYSKRHESEPTIQPRRTDFAPGERPLYFNNRGLFSDPFLAYHLPDLEKKSGRDSGSRYLNDYWNEPAYEGYNSFNLVYAQMLSMWDQYADLLPDYNEAQLEERWIKPILKLLGWSYEVQDSKTKQAKRNVPDYSLFSSEEDYIKAKKSKTDEAYFEHVLAVADAKAWRIPLDGIGRSNNNPSYQIVRYMEHADSDWGILTNGRFWRLYTTRSYSKHTTFYEIDLESLLVKRDDERFKYFYSFFRREAFLSNTSSAQCFLDVVFENGVYYAKDVEENLKRRVFEVVEGIARGFIGTSKLSEAEMKQAYEHSLYYLFRLMFILNCESKGLLAVDKTSDYYEYSLRKLITNLKAQYDGNQNWSSQARTYGLIADLFDLLAKGDDRIGIHGFGDEVFASGDRKFFETRKIQDHHLNAALVQLACDYSDDGEDLQFIDYKRLSEDHLGTLFEGLLEYQLTFAKQKMAVTKSGEVKSWNELSDKQRRGSNTSVIEKDQPYLASGAGERKLTGSYYTPSYVVDFIAKSTLEPLIAGKTNKEILKLRIVDPAMGSAHFLIGVIRYLEDVILENVNAGDESVQDSESLGVRWLILHNCIFGADINPLAVELAKFSLWIYSAERSQNLEPLSDQLFCIDSLLEEKRWATFRKSGGFDAVVGNPPYVRQEHLKQHKETFQSKFAVYHGMTDLYAYFIEQGISILSPAGRFGMIVSNKWFRTDSGAPLRAWLKEQGLTLIVDFGDLPVFKGIAAYPCIVIVDKSAKRKTFEFAGMKTLEFKSLEAAVDKAKFPLAVTSLEDSGWTFSDPKEAKLAKKLEVGSTSLADYIDGTEFYGIKTGCGDAFVVDKETADQLIKADPKCREIIKPFAFGREIQPYAQIKPKKFVLLMLRGIDLKKYPSVEKHLDKFKERLMPKPKDWKGEEWKGRKPGTYKWYELQDAVDYIDDFKKPKIMFLKFQVRPAFTLDTAGTLGNDAVWSIALEDYFLLAFLNSKVGWYLISRACTQIRGGYQLIFKYLGKVPVKSASTADEKKLAKEIESKAKLASKAAPEKQVAIRAEIDGLLFRYYGLNESEIKIVEAAWSTSNAVQEDLDADAEDVA